MKEGESTKTWEPLSVIVNSSILEETHDRIQSDPRRVDYWTYGKALSLDEIKQRPIWNTFSEAIKAEFEAAAARGPAELERMRALRAAYRAREAAEKEAQDKRDGW